MIIIEGKSGSGKTKKIIEWANTFNGDVALLVEDCPSRYVSCKAVSLSQVVWRHECKIESIYSMAAKSKNVAIDLNGLVFDERELLDLEHKLGLNIAITKQSQSDISVLNVTKTSLGSGEQEQSEMIEGLQQRVAALEGELSLIKQEKDEVDGKEGLGIQGTITLMKDQIVITDAVIVGGLEIGKHKLVKQGKDFTIFQY